jgi:hypothetical protein
MDEGIQEVSRLGRFKVYQDTSPETYSPIIGKVVYLEPEIYAPYEIIFKREHNEKENTKASPQ